MVEIDITKRDEDKIPPMENPPPVTGACTVLSAIFVITVVCLVVIWSVTR